MRFEIHRALTLAALTAAALFVSPADAFACGGFFCNGSRPVNQAAERIVFARGADGDVTAIIQIQYSGPSERFAWMLPVAGNPEIGVSSNSAFQQLQQATNPQYTLNTTVEGTCRDDFRGGFAAPSAAGAADAGAARDSMEPGVMVVNQGSVGPYDFVVINVDPAAEQPADVAVEWLQGEGFDVNDFGADRLGPYLESGMNLLAFRLTKGSDTGSIRPVTLSFGSGLPSIPIRPTAVAATDDMGVMVWVLGEHRAVPVNYLSLELNEALINWLNPNSNYNDVVTRAANEAGGQGFVTEMSGDAQPLADAIFQQWERDRWADIVEGDWTGNHGGLLQQALGMFSRHDGIREVVAQTIPLPMGVTREELLSCPTCYIDLSRTQIEGFDPAAFIEAMRVNVIEPLENTRELFDSIPYVTRFYTTMSADEMTVDPIFDENPDLPDYDRQHTADRVIECSPSVSRFEAPWRVTFDDGSVLRGAGQSWPFDTDGELPAIRVTRRLGTSGLGRVVEDNTASIQAALDESNADIPGPPAATGCAVSSGGSSSPGPIAFALALGAFLIGRRRRSAA